MDTVYLLVNFTLERIQDPNTHFNILCSLLAVDVCVHIETGPRRAPTLPRPVHGRRVWAIFTHRTRNPNTNFNVLCSLLQCFSGTVNADIDLSLVYAFHPVLILMWMDFRKCLRCLCGLSFGVTRIVKGQLCPKSNSSNCLRETREVAAVCLCTTLCSSSDSLVSL